MKRLLMFFCLLSSSWSVSAYTGTAWVEVRLKAGLPDASICKFILYEYKVGEHERLNKFKTFTAKVEGKRCFAALPMKDRVQYLQVALLSGDSILVDPVIKDIYVTVGDTSVIDIVDEETDQPADGQPVVLQSGEWPGLDFGRQFDLVSPRFMDSNYRYDHANKWDLEVLALKHAIEGLSDSPNATLQLYLRDKALQAEAFKLDMIRIYLKSRRLDRDSVIAFYNKEYVSLIHKKEGMPDDQLNISSKVFPLYLIRKKLLEHLIKLDRGTSYNRIYQELKALTSGELRDKVLTTYIASYSVVMNDLDSLVADARLVVQSSFYDSVLSTYVVPPNPAPLKTFLFTKPDGKSFSLADLKDKVIVLDYWFTGCTPCMIYYKNHFSKAEQYFSKDGRVVFVSVNVDKDPELWRRSVAGGKYSSKEAINLHDAKAAGQSLNLYFNISSYPFPIIIAPNGRPQKSRKLRTEQGIIETVNELLKSKD